MAFRERTVNGFVVNGDGIPVVGGQVKGMTTEKVSYTTTHIVVDPSYYTTTTTTGAFALTIWCDEDSLIPVNHKICFPIVNAGAANVEYFVNISLIYDDGSPVDIGSLVVLSQSSGAILDTESLRDVIQEEIAASGLSGTFTDFSYPASITGNLALSAEPDADELIGVLKAILQRLGAASA